MRDAAEFRVYTPGSNAGIPVSVLKSFAAPPQAIREDNELMRERVNTTATSLLGLLGIDADPIKSREHILLSNILNHAWSSGSDLDIAALIQQIQTPPLTRIGVMDLDSFFPAKDRFELAMALNNLLAAPGFSSWMEGEPLDVQQILYGPAGKPRVSIFSIAHLSDAERMFFVSLLLNQTLGWMRTQSGTTSLRAILYMDEIFGYFPPVANPPSKLPLLTLLKQGRAFGLGVVLATQNPVDLDYKGLSNTGTWFIGRLQTENDKNRVLEGLEGVAAGSDLKFDRQEMEETLAGLSSRIFLLNNVHDDAPEVFESRWAMSYLRGPLTRTQIKTLMEPIKQQASTSQTEATQQHPPFPPPHPQKLPARRASQCCRLILLSTSFRFAIVKLTGATLVYQPHLIGAAEVRFSDKRVDTARNLTLLAPIADGVVSVDWDQARMVDLPVSDLETSPQPGLTLRSCLRPAGRRKVIPRGKRNWRAGSIARKN